MRFVVAIFVREILVLISWIFVALVVRMLALRPMNVAGLSLEGLVLSLGGALWFLSLRLKERFLSLLSRL
jgi:hypothetical protein